MSINFKTIAISATIAAIATIMGFAGFFETAVYAQGNTTGLNATGNATAAAGAGAASQGCSHHKPTNQGTSNSASDIHAGIYIRTAGPKGIPYCSSSCKC